MFKSSATRQARGEPTTPRLRPRELSPTPDHWDETHAQPHHRIMDPPKSALKPAKRDAQPHHRTIKPTKSALKPAPPQPTGRRMIVRSAPLRSESPPRSSVPLQPRNANISNSQNTWPDMFVPPPIIPPVPAQPSQAPVIPRGPTYRYDEINRPVIPPPPPPMPTRETPRNRTTSEMGPQNSTPGGFTTILRSLTCKLWPASGAEQDGYESIPSAAAAPAPRVSRSQSHRPQNYGATQEPRYVPRTTAQPPVMSSRPGYPIYAPPPPQPQPQPQPQQSRPYYNYPGTTHPHYPAPVNSYQRPGWPSGPDTYGQSDGEAARQHYQSQRYRGASTDQYAGGQSDTEGRPPMRQTHQRPREQGGDGYSSDTTAMRQYVNPIAYGSGVAPQDLHQRLQTLQTEQYRAPVAQPPATQPSNNLGNVPRVGGPPNDPYIRLVDALQMQEEERNRREAERARASVPAHRPAPVPPPAQPSSTRPRRTSMSQSQPPPPQRSAPPAKPRGWSEPEIVRSLATISWPLREFRHRGHDDPKMFFDISQDPDDSSANRGIRVMYKTDYYRDRAISDPDKYLKFAPGYNVRYLNIKAGLTLPVLRDWDVIVEDQENGIRVIDVFRQIYRTYNVPLTPAELHKHRDLVQSEKVQLAYRARCRKSPGSTAANEAKGIYRVDLAGDRTLFLKLYFNPDGRRYQLETMPQDPNDICDSELVSVRQDGHYYL